MSGYDSDELLIQQLVDNAPNSEKALGTLFESYSGNLYGYLKAKMNVDEHLIEDVIQETFMTAANKIGTLTDGSKFYPWLVSIARNKMIDVIRHNQRYCDIQEWFDLAESDDDANPHDDLSGLQDTLSVLEPEEKDIVLMKTVLELNFNEISEVLSITVSAAKMRYYRSLERLKQSME